MWLMEDVLPIQSSATVEQNCFFQRRTHLQTQPRLS